MLGTISIPGREGALDQGGGRGKLPAARHNAAAANNEIIGLDRATILQGQTSRWPIDPATKDVAPHTKQFRRNQAGMLTLRLPIDQYLTVTSGEIADEDTVTSKARAIAYRQLRTRPIANLADIDAIDRPRLNFGTDACRVHAFHGKIGDAPHCLCQ